MRSKIATAVFALVATISLA
jgi:hypothetical protein